jgi:hypothetical protein
MMSERHMKIMVEQQVKHNRKRFVHAFTLIEVLVVAGIIVMLMAILIPSLSRARKQARAVICMGYLGQWGGIWSMYCQTNKDSFPGDIYENTGFYRAGWITCLRSLYDTKSEILRCPMATERHPKGVIYGGPFYTYTMPSSVSRGGGREECSYGINIWICNPPPEMEVIQGRPTKLHWRKPSKVDFPNRVPVFADSMFRGGAPMEAGQRGEPPNFEGEYTSPHCEMKHFCINRHNRFNNHLFMDWSVRRVGIKELWTLKWHREFDTAGPWTKAGRNPQYPWPVWLRAFPDY